MDGKELRDALPGIEAKAWQYASMCARHGLPRSVLQVDGGEIVHLTLAEEDGEPRFFRLVDGELVELVGLEGD